MTVLPYENSTLSKRGQVEKMFNSIAHRYDFLNHFLSMGIDIYWRNRAISLLKSQKPKLVLDVATGTADFAITALKSGANKVVGIDISENMLAFGRTKLKKKGLADKIELIHGDSENLPFEDNTFDAITVSFGVRNFQNLEKGLVEMARTLKPGGRLVVLEFSKPQKSPVKQVYNFYFKYILPKIGNIISKDDAAYRYLPESVNQFPEGPRFINILQNNGYSQTQCIPLTFGICSIYTGIK
ncbi:MAG: bifunctional demethylmenaquinone methyltransferase/2-methoxy-6-polyprenyl-1,4-benzoquinol methylase UbiE [Cytophagales bacterium]|nr:bifunctional demethylmenaquinone methyltransferase/2-methoxy-6-polyprenyl-1,4-benzoquinol methylase UbiE [Cytophagales bacterium]